LTALEPVLKQPQQRLRPSLKSLPEETRTEAQSTGNPDDYQQMASDIDTTLMNLSLMFLTKKSFDMGKPGQ